MKEKKRSELDNTRREKKKFYLLMFTIISFFGEHVREVSKHTSSGNNMQKSQLLRENLQIKTGFLKRNQTRQNLTISPHCKTRIFIKGTKQQESKPQNHRSGITTTDWNQTKESEESETKGPRHYESETKHFSY